MQSRAGRGAARHAAACCKPCCASERSAGGLHAWRPAASGTPSHPCQLSFLAGKRMKHLIHTQVPHGRRRADCSARGHCRRAQAVLVRCAAAAADPALCPKLLCWLCCAAPVCVPQCVLLCPDMPRWLAPRAPANLAACRAGGTVLLPHLPPRLAPAAVCTLTTLSVDCCLTDPLCCAALCRAGAAALCSWQPPNSTGACCAPAAPSALRTAPCPSSTSWACRTGECPALAKRHAALWC